MSRLIGVIGMFVLIGIAYLISEDRKKIDIRPVIGGLLLQLAFAFTILKLPIGKVAFQKLSDFIATILGFSTKGAEFLFGSLMSTGFSFALSVIPTIIFFSSLMSVLYYLGAIQRVVEFMAKIMKKVMNLSGAESLSAAANVFVGQTEAPLVVKRFVPNMTRSELMALMSGGMATVAGGVMAGYIGMGIDAGYLLAASIMSAPAALMMAKIVVPETKESVTSGEMKVDIEVNNANVIDAAAEGASEGLKLALNVAAMLLAFVSIIALINYPLSYLGTSLEQILGYIFAPLSLVMGVPMAEITEVGSLLGQKMALNEFVAYTQLSEMIKEGVLSHKAQLIATFALCGFSNFSSIAIQIGGLGSLAPERRGELAQLGVRALVAGSLATYMTATIAGILM
ncbi:CNT family concentrative nucleoside transporter [Orenia metallireducens]|jgi:CNT family concentrative nucleoside transporter|uniref:Nucleoside permease n=1 Tax=Orenia metallireducens TaxID=1413210 RepID=A0A285FXX2_9FIRM|nr:NupC/NupG family nucleoside CNT transporter [Orenia metallireducens]PRX35542.1 CNT family concentrative nucleoside transporter [Orenia metallireducens]SNY16127.1 concentrative nucleoside transporter, CNT family [Orenia metallireducens]